MTGVVLVSLCVVYALPVQDGDLWFHFAYAEYMLNHHTLILNHTIYSWTPTDNSAIYCNWIADFLLYFSYKGAGLKIIYCFVYVCLGVFLLVSVSFARRLGVLFHPATWLAILLGILMSKVASYQKPEMFSYVLICASAGVWFGMKIRPERWWLSYLFPLIMVVWVNTHGAFIFGLLFFLLVGFGEFLNSLFGCSCTLPRKTLHHLAIALLVSGLATIANPYGIAYPVQVVQNMFKGDELLRVVNAYDPVFSSAGQAMHYVEYFIIMVLLLLLLMWQSRCSDFSILLSNAVLGWLFAQFLRTTYFWVPVAALSIIYLLSRTDRLRFSIGRLSIAVTVIALCLSLYLGGRACFDAICNPPRNRWCGFGIGYQNPVIETEFLKTFHPGTRLGNTYNVGGYLLWALWPDYKVMVDPRYFPFREWLGDFFKFQDGQDFKKFLDRFPCDVFVVNYDAENLLNNFLISPDWKRGFFGPSAVVFVRKDVELPAESREFRKDRFQDIKNFTSALNAFSFAINVSDYSTAREILDAMQREFRCPNKKPKVKQCEYFYQGILSAARGKYEEAIEAIDQCREGGVIKNDLLLVKLRNWQTKKLAEQSEYKAALEQARCALAVERINLYALFNAGTLGWWIETTQVEKSNLGNPGSISMVVEKPGDWKVYLQQFLKLYGNRPDIPKPVLEIAREVLEKRYNKDKPFVIAPTEPPKIN